MTNVNEKYLRGEIIWVNIDDSQDSEQGGVRPALIIQNDVGNKYSPTLIVAFITSQTKRGLPTHIDVLPEDSGLTKKSTVLLEQIRTISKKRILGKAGQMDGNMLKCIDRALSISCGLCSNT